MRLLEPNYGPKCLLKSMYPLQLFHTLLNITSSSLGKTPCNPSVQFPKLWRSLSLSCSEPNTPAVQATAFGLAGLAGLVAWWVRPS
jgi:hypothetical protein